jgi:hypothetical protein
MAERCAICQRPTPGQRPEVWCKYCNRDWMEKCLFNMGSTEATAWAADRARRTELERIREGIEEVLLSNGVECECPIHPDELNDEDRCWVCRLCAVLTPEDIGGQDG